MAELSKTARASMRVETQGGPGPRWPGFSSANPVSRPNPIRPAMCGAKPKPWWRRIPSASIASCGAMDGVKPSTRLCAPCQRQDLSWRQPSP